MNFGIEDVKRWQWALLGILVGAALAYSQNEFADDTPGRTMDGYTFVSHLRRTPFPNGNKTPLPWVDNIVVFPKSDGAYWVRAQLLTPTDKPRVMKYKTHWLTDWSGVPTSPWGGRGRTPRPTTARSTSQPATQSTTQSTARRDVSVLTFLEQSSEQFPHVTYRIAWWTSPQNRIITYSAAGLVLVGGVWPTLIALLTGAGFGRPKREVSDYDLSRFKGEATPAPAPPPPADTEALDERLAAMEAELLAGLSKDVATRYEEPVPEPVRTLKRGGAVTEMADLPAIDGQDKEYKGEFYPVALPAEKHEH